MNVESRDTLALARQCSQGERNGRLNHNDNANPQNNFFFQLIESDNAGAVTRNPTR